MAIIDRSAMLLNPGTSYMVHAQQILPIPHKSMAALIIGHTQTGIGVRCLPHALPVLWRTLLSSLARSRPTSHQPPSLKASAMKAAMMPTCGKRHRTFAGISAAPTRRWSLTCKPCTNRLTLKQSFRGVHPAGGTLKHLKKHPCTPEASAHLEAVQEDQLGIGIWRPIVKRGADLAEAHRQCGRHHIVDCQRPKRQRHCAHPLPLSGVCLPCAIR